ncbi:uncharacterized protein HD556DRAFT_1250378 [Suillus plorans]|uniref:Uncharacterized protein n=1 Tax=Suillus plorans TaxID=116603 RepID=A0A9P7A9Y6_9AGAM|nr:uncharacterized protein HD556DRAFT_1250378 [Suillus plorans]KAG1785139.1 hypothetical protein HD556DRAFT_1250378 [Suillus plorans]
MTSSSTARGATTSSLIHHQYRPTSPLPRSGSWSIARAITITLDDPSGKLFLEFVDIKLNNARAPFKALRDAEAVLGPKCSFRAGLQAVHESESQKWDAIREFGEKLVILSQASKPIIAALPPIPPSSPYTGTQETATARTALQNAQDNYTPGSTYFATHPGANLLQANTQSFGESHTSELDSLASNPEANTGHPGVPITPPPQAAEKFGDTSHSPPPIDPRTLNLSPAPILEDHSLPPIVIPVDAPMVGRWLKLVFPYLRVMAANVGPLHL